MKALLILIAMTGLLSNCNKNKSHNGLIGKWKMAETFRIGQPWQPVTPSMEVVLTFNSNNTYTIVPPLISSASGCEGAYKVTNSNTVMMTPSCPPNAGHEEEFGFTIDGNTLIIDHRTTSSGVKSKYVRQ